MKKEIAAEKDERGVRELQRDARVVHNYLVALLAEHPDEFPLLNYLRQSDTYFDLQYSPPFLLPLSYSITFFWKSLHALRNTRTRVLLCHPTYLSLLCLISPFVILTNLSFSRLINVCVT